MTTKEMNEIETELIMLGTGNATVTKCYNTCFILKTKETVLLDRKSTRLNSSHTRPSRMPSSA